MNESLPTMFLVIRTAKQGDEMDIGASVYAAYSEDEIRGEVEPKWRSDHPAAEGWDTIRFFFQEIPNGQPMEYTREGQPTEYYTLKLERVAGSE